MKWVKGEKLDVFMRCAWLLTDENDTPLGRLHKRQNNWRGWDVAVLGERKDPRLGYPLQVARIVVDTKAEGEREIIRLRALHLEVVALSDDEIIKLNYEKCEDPYGSRTCGRCRSCMGRREYRVRRDK